MKGIQLLYKIKKNTYYKSGKSFTSTIYLYRSWSKNNLKNYLSFITGTWNIQLINQYSNLRVNLISYLDVYTWSNIKVVNPPIDNK